ncbi:hypothetical protein B0H10DRAFT_2217949 [Mycena sp. CBHHK59/15]|nr:hypothetical protein B0H10DRAFT_2217949 [Mycena sp. CBHHK59/15]
MHAQSLLVVLAAAFVVSANMVPDYEARVVKPETNAPAWRRVKPITDSAPTWKRAPAKPVVDGAPTWKRNREMKRSESRAARENARAAPPDAAPAW